MELETTNLGVAVKPLSQPVTTNILTTSAALPLRTSSYLPVKRLMDVIGSGILIVCLLTWLIPLLFILIRLSSKGPLFFVQRRTGRGGKSFPCIKFRTMRVNTHSHELQANHDDTRITGIGRFLRATHIDELPQLFNVLLNQMSLIGPRPHMLYHDELFASMLPQYPQRHLVKPGITGLAQSYGYFGATPDFFSISARTRLDLFYVRHISLGLDLKIALSTLYIVPAKLISRTREPNS